MIKYGGLFLFVLCVLTLFGWLPDRLLNPVRSSELGLLYRVYTEGPGGFDDAVQGFIRQNPKRYAGPLVYMLETARPDSRKEEVALAFVEFAVTEPQVVRSLRRFAEEHSNSKTRDLAKKILQAKPATRGTGIYRVILSDERE